MSFFDRFRSQKSYGGLVANNLDISRPEIYSREAAQAEFRGWLFGIVNLVANNVAQAPLRLYVKTKDSGKKVLNYRTKSVCLAHKRVGLQSRDSMIEEIFGHPAQQLLRKVNNYTDGFALLYSTQAILDLVGDAYWLILRDTTGVPAEIQQLNPLLVYVVPNSNHTAIMGYKYLTRNGGIQLSIDEVVRFSNPSICDSKFSGVSPAIAMSAELEKLKKAGELEYSLMKNAGVPPIILKYKGLLDKKKIRELENQWKRATTNDRNGGIKVIDSEFSVEKIAQSLEELMFKDSKIFDLKSVALAYGVPYSLLDVSDQKKAGLDQMLEMLALNCLQPRLARIVEVLNQQFIPMFDTGDALAFAFDDPSPKAPKQEADVLTAYVQAEIITREEARQMLGMSH